MICKVLLWHPLCAAAATLLETLFAILYLRLLATHCHYLMCALYVTVGVLVLLYDCSLGLGIPSLLVSTHTRHLVLWFDLGVTLPIYEQVLI